MKLFEHRMADTTFQITSLVVVINMLCSIVVSVPLGFAAGYQVAIGVGGGSLILMLTVQGIRFPSNLKRLYIFMCESAFHYSIIESVNAFTRSEQNMEVLKFFFSNQAL